MMLDRRVLAVVPARGGSKGVPLKNIHPLDGKPLIAHVADAVKELEGMIDRTVVSTDHDEIAKEAAAVGLDVPFRRPDRLSGDRVGDLEVLVHATRETERIDDVHYDVIVMLQPTSPLRRARHVRACVRKLIDESFDAVWTVSPTDLKYHPLKQLSLGADGRLTLFDERGAQIVARQQLTPVYHRNGCAYAFTRSCIVNQKTTFGSKTGAVIITEPMISIDSEEDFAKVESVLSDRAVGR